MSAVLPQSMAGCTPSRECPQAHKCARALAVRTKRKPVDASIGLVPGEGCALFIDQAGLGLLRELEVAAYRPLRNTVADLVIQYLGKHGTSSYVELEIALGLPPNTVRSSMKLSVQAGLVHRCGPRMRSAFALGPAPEVPDESEFQHRIVTEWQPINLPPRAARSVFEMAAP